jgi:hypothetical protein
MEIGGGQVRVDGTLRAEAEAWPGPASRGGQVGFCEKLRFPARTAAASLAAIWRGRAGSATAKPRRALLGVAISLATVGLLALEWQTQSQSQSVQGPRG